MARTKTGTNKSEAIREAFKELPNAKAKEIVAHLKEKGVEVAEGLVYQVKKMSKRAAPAKRPSAKAPAAPKAPIASSNGVMSVGASIAAVKSLAGHVGGMGALKEIVDALQ